VSVPLKLQTGNYYFLSIIHWSQTCWILSAGVNDVRQTEIHTVQPLVPKPIAFEIVMAVEELKRCKSLCIDQIPAE
jgi:hypothetical protein